MRTNLQLRKLAIKGNENNFFDESGILQIEDTHIKCIVGSKKFPRLFLIITKKNNMTKKIPSKSNY